MSIFQKLFGGSSKKSSGSSQWDSVLAKADLALARDEIASMHSMVNAQAEKEGGADGGEAGSCPGTWPGHSANTAAPRTHDSAVAALRPSRAMDLLFWRELRRPRPSQDAHPALRGVQGNPAVRDVRQSSRSIVFRQ